ncbi:MAG: hypothetical protein ACD_58C00131G0023 [uncultured bacterium]|nr:MAG: hypothetical protein ACD_58C00131G0023 [uncultured bacterium]
MNNYGQVIVDKQDPVTGWVLPLVGIAGGILLILIIIWLVVRYFRSSKIRRADNWTMFQINMPREIKRPDDPNNNKSEDFRQLIAVADNFFSSMAGLYKSGSRGWLGQPKLSFEIVAKNGEIYFFIGVPKELITYLEKQVNSHFPHAQLERTDNFKIFTPETKISYSSLRLSRKFVYPLKTYKVLDSDPLNGLTNIMSKLKDGDTATVQILARPSSGTWRHACVRAVSAVKDGKQIYDNNFIWFMYGILDFVSGALSSMNSKKNPEQQNNNYRFTPHQDELMKAINEKAGKVGFQSQIRIIATSKTQEEADLNNSNIVSAFSQYKAPEWNGFKKVGILPNKKKFLTNFILREFNFRPYSILNSEELSTIWHPPNKYTETPNIFWMKSRLLAPPADMPTEGLMIGESHYRGEVKNVYIKQDDRRRHMFMIGKTGVGKTTLYLNMIKQDIEKGYGCCFIDPNGDAADLVLKFVPKERAEDVIYFDPSDAERPMGLNMLDWKRPEDKDFLISEWLEIFYKLFDPNKTGMVGPQFEHWGRNASLTIMAQPEGGSLIEIPRLFTDDAFREKCISYVKDPVVLAFWNQQMAKTADFHKSEMFNYFISKFGRFMTNDLVRNIIGQAKSAFDIREAMDSGKILVINLSKGKLGEMNSYLLGMILVSKIQVAAFQRADMPEEQRKDFYLYVDEFQNFTTNSFKTILSEARKYRLNLAITNQYIKQLTEEIRDAAIGNAGTLLCYRMGAEDAEFMVKEFPGVTEQDLTNLPFASLYVKLLINGTPSKPFSMKGVKAVPTQTDEQTKAIKELSRLKYGKNKLEVEEDIRKRTLSQDNAAPPESTPREASYG